MKSAAELSPGSSIDALTLLETGSEPMLVKIGGVTKLLRAQPIAGTDWRFVLAPDAARQIII
ncbi:MULTISPECIES: hypothetical protein [Paraburkholderia]|uniref:Uncharacterized protein n=1 Tax=Paraburkholderia podalyriae TaxID=1938811 RepID=A0ABR7PU74_9BURK|nr:hypothetical protein [Paraburkholderia podalyriae]MBC8749825.1 hypothetical protein [Paraburkholderia podalyriae]